MGARSQHDGLRWSLDSLTGRVPLGSGSSPPARDDESSGRVENARERSGLVPGGPGDEFGAARVGAGWPGGGGLRARESWAGVRAEGEGRKVSVGASRPGHHRARAEVLGVEGEVGRADVGGQPSVQVAKGRARVDRSGDSEGDEAVLPSRETAGTIPRSQPSPLVRNPLVRPVPKLALGAEAARALADYDDPDLRGRARRGPREGFREAAVRGEAVARA